MAEKAPRRSFWFNVESIIISAFFLFFIIWAARKCNDEAHLRQAKDGKYREQQKKDSIAKAQRTMTSPTVTTTSPAPTPSTITTTTTTALPPTPQRNPQTATPPTPQSAPANNNGATNQQMLWVVIEGLNVREKPSLKAKSFGKLSLYDKVTFLGETTKETQKLSLGAVEADEPWVKIKTKKGTVGWVYGAGVSFYKNKKKGTF
jgi:hypothetical protein